ncbi:roundabout homolog 4 isoform X2 [Dendropsophus ebraccatus]|uniref:roundabout homolog 4 isoform X2 n=1 Tax=Dendropsophus ebraccatus TaxID=150705 RepID=UPI0038316BD4
MSPVTAPAACTKVLKDEFRQEPLDRVVIAGRTLVIDCSPPKGHPEPVVTWRKNGVLLDRNNSRYVFAAGRLSIAPTLSSDAGVYMCVASNQAGERTSRGAVISVLEMPQFTSKPGDVVVKPGSTVQFTCGAQGNPKPFVQWGREQGTLPIGRYAVTNENTLCLQRVTVQDSGTYVCTARNNIGAVSASANLVVQDPLDTGQIERELSSVNLHLDAVTLHNSSSVRVQWMASSSSQYTEGYTLFIRSHTPSGSDWEKWGVYPVNENMAVISGLHRGQKYEVKVRPYGWTVYGADSNIRHVLIPEEAPGPAPQDVNVTLVGGGNESVIVSWAPPPQGGRSITAYKIWCFGNETLPPSNWTVDGGTLRLEIPLLLAGIRYQVQVAAMYESGMGQLSNPKFIFIETQMMKDDEPDGAIPLDLLLQVVKHPAFIATVGGATWLMLMAAVIYLCQRNSKRYSKKKHSGLYRFASEDTIIKHRMDTSDSPWLSNTWKSASCSRNYSSTTSMNSQLLWMENKDTADFHKSTISFELKSEGSRSQIIPLVPDSSMYGALCVDQPGKDLTTFQSSSPVRPPGMGISSKSAIPLGLYDHSLFPHCHGSANNLTHGGARNKIPGRPVVPVPPNVALKEPWSHNLKRELHHVNSAPLSPYIQKDGGGSVPSVKSLDGKPAGKGEYSKVMKTFSSPKILHYTTSLKVMDLLPYSGPLPPPPVPPPEEEPSGGQWDKPVPKMAAEQQQDSGNKPIPFSKKKPPPDSLLFRHTSSVSLSVHDDTVLTPDDVAHYLEFNEHGERTRHPSESDSTLPQPFSTSSNTYGYICSPSELAEGDAADEDDDLDLGELSSLKSYRKYCETPTSSISEYESSMAGSLVNGWGSVSEDNYTSARCSMVSSSDGSFLMDASFAKALAVAVDSFCLGITQPELAGVDRISTDFSPSVSPLDGLLAVQNQGDGTDLNSRQPKVNPLPVLDWNIDWMDELEAKYRHRSQTKLQYPFSKKVEPFK